MSANGARPSASWWARAFASVDFTAEAASFVSRPREAGDSVLGKISGNAAAVYDSILKNFNSDFACAAIFAPLSERHSTPLAYARQTRNKRSDVWCHVYMCRGFTLVTSDPHSDPMYNRSSD